MPSSPSPRAPISRRRFLLTMGVLAATSVVRPRLSAAATLAGPTGLQTVTRTSVALGSSVSITALNRSKEQAQRAVDAAFSELEMVDELMSIYRPHSQVSLLNRQGFLDNPHPYLLEVLNKSQSVARQTNGAFDITVQPLWDLYAAASKAGRLPDPAALAATLARVDWKAIELSPQRITLGHPGMAITLNGIAQGYAADRALAALRKSGIEHALINTGELAAIGAKADGQPWSVGIQHPRQKDAYIALAKLDGRCLATSGDYETSFSPDHSANHIFDPATGRSPQAFSSVSIAAATGIDADALSTALFVLNLDDGMKLIRQTPGASALFVLRDGRVVKTNDFPAD